ncbi:hypothetical protein BGX28_001056 [Mortierella sp. GBA30]|nr:hypothetical protein BGX28_001056 [Mortierella sp. GBA30]
MGRPIEPSQVFGMDPIHHGKGYKNTVLKAITSIIEMDGKTWAGNSLGQLSIIEGGVKAQLVIGNHRLDGKVIKLDKPLLLIKKQPKSLDNTSHDTSLSGNKGKDISKEYSDRDEQYRRFSPVPPPSPLRHDDDDTMTSVPGGDYGDATGVAGMDEGAMDPLAPSNIREKILYDTVAVIRQKILFNTMPVPIIHTERRGLTVIKRGV